MERRDGDAPGVACAHIVGAGERALIDGDRHAVGWLPSGGCSDHFQRAAPHLIKAAVGRCERDITVTAVLILKIIRAADIVFQTSAADGGIFAVAVQIKLDLALASPAAAV